MSNYFLELVNIKKSFNHINVLNNINMQIENGKIYGLVGENGAGKSVLVNIISGLYKPDSGDIYIQGNRVELNKPQVVRELKITTLHQSLSLIEDLTVAENVFLGDYIIKGKYFRHIDWKEINNKCKYYFKILGFKIDPKDFVRDLNYSQKQVVEIAKALSRDSRMIIFDEPTIFLNNVEIENFRKILKNLADKGITIMYISHQLKEVINLCDSIFVIRDGQIATNIQKPYVNEDLIIKHMTRITISDIYPKLPNRIDRPVLRVDSVSTESDIRNVSFFLRKGEILGISGLLGSGRAAIARALFGLDRRLDGSITINETKTVIKNPRDAIKERIGYLCEDTVNNLINNLGIIENITVSNIHAVKKAGFMLHKKEKKIAQDFIWKFHIKAPDLYGKIDNLSKGTQQKVAICRWVFARTNILLLEEPTNGLDKSTKIELYNFMNFYIQNGKSIILISSDINELMGMCDRILILYDKKIIKEIYRKDFSEEKLIFYAMGGENPNLL